MKLHHLYDCDCLLGDSHRMRLNWKSTRSHLIQVQWFLCLSREGMSTLGFTCTQDPFIPYKRTTDLTEITWGLVTVVLPLLVVVSNFKLPAPCIICRDSRASYRQIVSGHSAGNYIATLINSRAGKFSSSWCHWTTKLLRNASWKQSDSVLTRWPTWIFKPWNKCNLKFEILERQDQKSKTCLQHLQNPEHFNDISNEILRPVVVRIHQLPSVRSDFGENAKNLQTGTLHGYCWTGRNFSPFEIVLRIFRWSYPSFPMTTLTRESTPALVVPFSFATSRLLVLPKKLEKQ